ncbi:MAG: PhzF family phenazine biosynthesis protein [Thermodesulfobacteriota bacterium]
MAIDIYQVDAFTETPFGGNPAAVCVLPGPADPLWMQHVAREMNLSETAFLYRENRGYNLRWFTPAVEVEICGHATLASAHILWETGRASRGEAIEFYTLSGVLTAAMRGDMIELDFPSEPESKADAPAALAGSLGVKPLYVGRNRFDYLVEVGSEKEVRAVKPDFALLGTIPVRGVMVTSASDLPEYDFVCRFFGPASGIDEDPATGSAYCCLGPYWEKKLGKSEFLAYRASGRGGVIGVRVLGERVKLMGRAVTVFKGVMCV